MYFAGIIGGIVFVASVIDFALGHRFSEHGGDSVIGVIIPLALLTFGYLIPRMGYYLSFWHERELMEFVKHTFAAKET